MNKDKPGVVGSREGHAGPEGGTMLLTPPPSAAALARLTDGLALIVCAAKALRAAEEDEVSSPDFGAEISALRQGIAAVQRAASDLGLALVVPSIAESVCPAGQ